MVVGGEPDRRGGMVDSGDQIGGVQLVGYYLGWLVLAALVVQIALGIATLLAVVPLTLAAAHQAGAVVLFALALHLAHALARRTPAQGAA